MVAEHVVTLDPVAAASVAEPLGATLAALHRLNAEGLRNTWRRLLNTEPPSMRSRALLRMELAWALQANTYGDLDAKTRRVLHIAARQTASTRKSGSTLHLSPGSILLREWRGTPHRVEVLADGFLFEGKTYRSLSAIARHIAGVPWSGPKFFGLIGSAAARESGQ